jgi:spore photoproduct lyase
VTNWKTSFRQLVKRVYIERKAAGTVAAQRAREVLTDVEFHLVDDRSEIPAQHLKGTTCYLCLHRGDPVGPCPGTKQHLCCNYHTVDLYSGCGIGCSYCIMRSYLNFSPVTVYADPRPSIDRIAGEAKKRGGRPLRVGTGETGDSLLYDPVFRLSEEFVGGLSGLANVHFEMKTKTDFVDHLLNIPRKGNAIIGFSLNPPEIGTAEEGFSSPVEQRIAAARKAVSAGYRTSFHFDPVIKTDLWEKLYFPLVDSLAGFRDGSVAWISLGTFRYPPQLKDRIAQRPYLYDEFVPSRDGKYRYLQRERVRIYRLLLERLRTVSAAPIYLCMESDAVWKRVFGALPHELPELRGIFDSDRDG